jgi:hypothetical protein
MTAAEIVAASLMRSAEQRRQEARWQVRHGSSREEFHAIVFLWRDRHGFKRPQG